MDRIPYDVSQPDRKYDEKHNVEVHSNKVFFDDGYRKAFKGEIIKVDDDDLYLLVKVGQVAKLGHAPVAPPKKPVPTSPAGNASCADKVSE